MPFTNGGDSSNILTEAMLSAGQKIAHFEVLEKLGAGGMGVVYKAWDVHLDRLVTLKVLPPARADDAAMRSRLLREARAASALNHSNIVTIYEAGSADGIDFIAMEYVEGTKHVLARYASRDPGLARSVTWVQCDNSPDP